MLQPVPNSVSRDCSAPEQAEEVAALRMRLEEVTREKKEQENLALLSREEVDSVLGGVCVCVHEDACVCTSIVCVCVCVCVCACVCVCMCVGVHGCASVCIEFEFTLFIRANLMLCLV